MPVLDPDRELPCDELTKNFRARILAFLGFMFVVVYLALLLFRKPEALVVLVNAILFILFDEYLKEGYWFRWQDLFTPSITHEKIVAFLVAATILKAIF